MTASLRAAWRRAAATRCARSALCSPPPPRVVESDVGFGVAPANATTLPWVVHTLVRALGARIGAAAAEVRGASARGRSPH